MNKRIIVGLLLVMIPFMAVFADGGGGVLFGMQTATYPFLESYRVPNNSSGLAYYGGYGYGISEGNHISGGFGFALTDPVHDTKIAGGFGGVISGIRVLKLPINLSIISWTGFGGIYTGTQSSQIGLGFFCVSEEVTLEAGIPLQRWLMPVVYVGYQVAGNLVPGKTFQSFVSYTPVIGVRLAWGKFSELLIPELPCYYASVPVSNRGLPRKNV